MAALKEAGCAGISNALQPIQDSRVLRRAMEYAATYDFTLHAVPLDTALSKDGVAHEGPIATRLGLPGIPAAAETISLARYLALVEDVGVRVHFGRLSTARGVNMIAQAKARGLPVTADVAIHHLHLTETAVDNFNSQAHVIPPLRSADDREALLAAVRAGSIDAICADHQPHNADAKLNPFPSTEPGISGLDTLLGLCLLLSQSGALTIMQALKAVTAAPAAILEMPLGRLAPGSPADICIFDPGQNWTVGPDTLNSAGHNTPFMGWKLPGKVTQTLVDGQPML
jgi:dihydroorotase